MVDLPSIYPDLERNFTTTGSGSTICSYSKKIPRDGPIVVLIHGYPQSAYIWRYMVPKLIPYVSVFVPEVRLQISSPVPPILPPQADLTPTSVSFQLPSYGISTPTKEPLTKRLMGESILDALKIVFSLPLRPKTQIIFLAHDRGARVAHRLAVDFAYPTTSTSPILSHLDIQGVVLMDILPLTVQWAVSATIPSAATAYFHWAFLARPDMAIPMIKAYGGDTFCRDLLIKGCGKNEMGRVSFFARDSAEIYERNFATEDAIKGACEDYTDGATTDVQLQKEDQEVGRKIAVPVLVLWSMGGIGRWGDVGDMWKKDWVKDGVKVEGLGIGEDVGHYLAEEAPDIVMNRVTAFLESLGVKMG